MKKCRPATPRNLSLLLVFLFAFTVMNAQMDYETAKKITNFSSTTAVTDDVIFMDQGTGNLVNGTTEIFISPEIAATIDGKRIEEAVIVSIQLEGKSNGIYISKKNKNTFVLTELKNGTSNAKFSYQIVVKK